MGGVTLVFFLPRTAILSLPSRSKKTVSKNPEVRVERVSATDTNTNVCFAHRETAPFQKTLRSSFLTSPLLSVTVVESSSGN